MAFEVPSHLKRSEVQVGSSSRILNDISEATTKTLNVELASSWVADLDKAIQQTKDRIHERIISELSTFEQQLDSSLSVQTRLKNLTTHVEQLSDSFSNTETGLLPTLLGPLKEYSGLAKRTADTRVTYDLLSHLSTCNSQFSTLNALAHEGRLPEAVSACRKFGELLDAVPDPLPKAAVLIDLKRQHQIVKNRLDEQLSDAYTRTIRITASELSISPSVQVRQSNTFVSLSDILLSLSPSARTEHLAILKRDLITHFIENPLQRPVLLETSESRNAEGSSSQILSISPTSPSTSPSTPPFELLSTLFSFLSQNLFPHLQETERSSMRNSLCKPTLSAVLRLYLTPQLPLSLSELPSYLQTVTDALSFEREYVTGLFKYSGGEDLKDWARRLGSFYGRKRRTDLLEKARKTITFDVSGRGEELEGTFTVEVIPEPEPVTAVDVVAVQEPESELADDAWGLDEPTEDSLTNQNGHAKTGVKENGAEDISMGDDTEDAWGLEDDVPVGEDEDPSAAWGWGDESEAPVEDNSDAKNDETGDEVVDESAWDTAWDDPPPPTEPSPPPSPKPKSVPTKVAKGLAKFSNKGKANEVDGNGSAPPSANLSPSLPLSSKWPSQQVQTQLEKSGPHGLHVEVDKKVKKVEKLTYLISRRTKELLRLIDDIIDEGQILQQTELFREFLGMGNAGSSIAANVILQTPSLVFELYRAIYPVAFSSQLETDPSRSIKFSNDCLYLAEETRARLKTASVSGEDMFAQLRASADQLESLGQYWFSHAVDNQVSSSHEILSAARGFVDTALPEHFDECEVALSNVLRNTVSVGHQWKTLLTRPKYYQAVGTVAEEILNKILQDILALHDIPADDSQKLSELCRILNSLERLFIDDSSPEAPSLVGAYVPSWFKFSYLPELLEASMVDISYLFDGGFLSDFKVEELTELVRALFADTPLRANTIAKIQRGHPPVQ